MGLPLSLLVGALLFLATCLAVCVHRIVQQVKHARRQQLVAFFATNKFSRSYVALSTPPSMIFENHPPATVTQTVPEKLPPLDQFQAVRARVVPWWRPLLDWYRREKRAIIPMAFDLVDDDTLGHFALFLAAVCHAGLPHRLAELQSLCCLLDVVKWRYIVKLDALNIEIYPSMSRRALAKAIFELLNDEKRFASIARGEDVLVAVLSATPRSSP
ncbi:hypothetical protein Ae201684P_001420 [Aphanomyces euteiches]|uniref:Uncharacterized protein n=1 Tax=Aphanomyces euteiches TaxID=100861 RepID=A0A6G0WTG3_9STRA|nr:hypothetical protein Ae201684_011835 [Aphanomyces euteiches]KAH9089215.1 hypothetical protein Ae201684P_001420 [Aphanomyces euteiches]KAH9157395.1 hypothetical protein AeRB84_000759 [Aphanomyces euteiches]